MPPVKAHNTDVVHADWDGAAQVARLGDAYTKKDLKNVFTWLPDGKNPVKSDAKMPHHQVSAVGAPGDAVVEGCQAAIGVLNGAMGGADIPDDDRQGVYDHLAAHLKDAGETPAELKSAGQPAAEAASGADPGEPPGSADESDIARAAAPETRPPDAELTPTRTHSATSPRRSAPHDTRGDAPMPVPVDLAERAAVRGVERRSTPFCGVELREKPDGTGKSSLHFEGYACVTETGYEMEDWAGAFTEIVRAGAFTTTLQQNADVPFKINHEGLTLARTKSGTMRLAEDSTGLHVDADLDPGSPHVKGLRSAMDRGDVDEMSFAFWVTRSEWSPDWMQRDIIEVNLNKGDVSVVNYGANPNTAGASLRGKALLDHVKLLTARERRDLLDRLFAEFHPEAPAPDALLLADRTAMLAWVRDRSAELREGKALSAATMTVLSQVLDLVAAADVAVDSAQPLLADLMGVDNPDDEDADAADDPDGDTPDTAPEDGGNSGQDGAPAAPEAACAPIAVYQRRLRALELTV
jgi:HK97 family phage prohead protease